MHRPGKTFTKKWWIALFCFLPKYIAEMLLWLTLSVHATFVCAHMWCDLRKPVTWCKIDILSSWYHVKVWIILFPELFTWVVSDTGIKSYWCSKATKIKKNIRNVMLLPLFCSFTFCDMWQVFPDHITFSKGNHV